MDTNIDTSISEVTVLLPAYNAEKYLADAVDSILKQTFSDFELLIINDGSTDKTLSILNSFNDSRIRIIKHAENKGLIYSLNEGLNFSKSKYIVRMDADDIALPDRLKVQVDFMNQHQDISAAGSYYQIIGREEIQKMPNSNDTIKVHMLFHTAMAHPTIILRRDRFIDANYLFDQDFKHAEDYELWSRACVSLKFANIPQVLLKYRFHEEQVSTKFNKIQRDTMNLVQINLLSNLGISISSDEKVIQRGIAYSEYGNDKKYLIKLLEWLRRIDAANATSHFFDEVSLGNYLSVKWFLISGHLALNGICPPIKNMNKNFNTSNYVYLKNTFYLLIKIMIGQIKKLFR
jgi:glycosyltransferase involved in cell wall biosynthesis